MVETDNKKCVKGFCGYFDGTTNAKLELPYFSNNFASYSEYTVSFWYRRLQETSQEEQGLVNMGVCQDGGPLHITSPTASVCQATAKTQAGESTLSAQVSTN